MSIDFRENIDPVFAKMESKIFENCSKIAKKIFENERTFSRNFRENRVSRFSLETLVLYEQSYAAFVIVYFCPKKLYKMCVKIGLLTFLDKRKKIPNQTSPMAVISYFSNDILSLHLNIVGS